nr:unnamed protein product [Digitaria exilis]
MGATAIFLRVTYAAALAYAGAGLLGPVTGMCLAHLTTAWAAGLLGYALAEYRIADGGELAADEAAARGPAASRSEGEGITFSHSVFLTVLGTLYLGSGVAWILFFTPDDGEVSVVLLSVLIWMILYMWAIFFNRFLLHEALVSSDFMGRLVWYYVASIVVSMLSVRPDGPMVLGVLLGVEDDGHGGVLWVHSCR